MFVMPMRSSLLKHALGSLLFVCLLPASPRIIALSSGGAIAARATPQGTVLTVEGRPHVAKTLVVKTDETVAKGGAPALKVVGEGGSHILIIEDTYYSKPGGLSECKAGKEQFLRVVALGEPSHETLSLKLASCRQNLELADPGVVWSAASGILEIHWLAAPAARYRITETGQAERLEAK